MPLHRGHLGTSSMGTTWCLLRKVSLGVTLVPYPLCSPTIGSGGGVGMRSFFSSDCWFGGCVGSRSTVLSDCWSGFILWAGVVGNVISNSGVGVCSEPTVRQPE